MSSTDASLPLKFFVRRSGKQAEVHRLRMPLSVNFAEVCAVAEQWVPRSTRLSVHYCDEDGDAIRVDSEEEWAECVRLHQDRDCGGVLTLNIHSCGGNHKDPAVTAASPSTAVPTAAVTKGSEEVTADPALPTVTELYAKNMQVMYHERDGTKRPAVITHVDTQAASYGIRFSDGDERWTEHSRLTPIPAGTTQEASGAKPQTETAPAATASASACSVLISPRGVAAAKAQAPTVPPPSQVSVTQTSGQQQVVAQVLERLFGRGIFTQLSSGAVGPRELMAEGWLTVQRLGAGDVDVDVNIPRLANFLNAKACALMDSHATASACSFPLSAADSASQAVEWLRLAHSLSPDDAVTAYNLACANSLLGDVDVALCALDDAVRLGYRDAAHMSVDPDLAQLRTHCRFTELLRAAGAGGEAAVVDTAPLTEPAPSQSTPVTPLWRDELAALRAMGLDDDERALAILRRHDGNLNAAVCELLNTM